MAAAKNNVAMGIFQQFFHSLVPHDFLVLCINFCEKLLKNSHRNTVFAHRQLISTPCAGASTLAARQRSTLTRITKIGDFGMFLQSFFKFEHSIVFSSSRRSKWVQLQPFWTLLLDTALREVLSSNVVSPHVSVHCAAPERPRKKRRHV